MCLTLLLFACTGSKLLVGRKDTDSHEPAALACTLRQRTALAPVVVMCPAVGKIAGVDSTAMNQSTVIQPSIALNQPRCRAIDCGSAPTVALPLLARLHRCPKHGCVSMLSDLQRWHCTSLLMHQHVCYCMSTTIVHAGSREACPRRTGCISGPALISLHTLSCMRPGEY